MKKISLFTLVLMGGLAASAQDQDHKPMRTEMSTATRFGLKGGVNLATLEIDDDASSGLNTNMKTSFNLGAFVNIPITDRFRIQPEVMYSGQGTKGSIDSDESFEYDFHYINIPIMAQLQTAGGFFLETGPQVGFMISSKLDVEGQDVDIEESVKKTDFGWGAGIGYLSRIGLGLGARYVHGFSNVWDRDGANPSEDMQFSNRTVQISLIYHLGAHK